MLLAIEQRRALVAWAESNPRVRRVWVYGGDSRRNERRDTDLDLAIELAPAVDGDESIALCGQSTTVVKGNMYSALAIAGSGLVQWMTVGRR